MLTLITVVVQMSSMNTHLHAMTRSIWLERIWTIQEFALAAKATVHYGPISCVWDAFNAAIMDDFNQLVFTFEIEDSEDERFRLLYALRESTRSLRSSTRSLRSKAKTKQTQSQIPD
jgi:hypothetical protein